MSESGVLSTVKIYSSTSAQDSGPGRRIYFLMESEGEDFLGIPYPHQLIEVQFGPDGKVAHIRKGDG